MSTAVGAPIAQEQRLRLSAVPWSSYEAFLKLFEGRHVRVTYDRGELEIMTVSPRHERCKKLLARLLEALTEELDIAILGLGNTTYRREEHERGLEPDECWYITHEERMRGRDEFDPAIDPPPDLALEIEISRSTINRMEIYAVLGVPEIWRYNGETLRVCQLQPDGSYPVVAQSAFFPSLEMLRLQEFLQRRGEVSETQLVKEFRQWIRASFSNE
jgi:Uma2 family endonuclease